MPRFDSTIFSNRGCTIISKFFVMNAWEEQWCKTSDPFEELWNMPHAVGVLDGKHFQIKCPKLSGSLYHNYKGFFKIVLLTTCDARTPQHQRYRSVKICVRFVNIFLPLFNVTKTPIPTAVGGDCCICFWLWSKNICKRLHFE